MGTSPSPYLFPSERVAFDTSLYVLLCEFGSIGTNLVVNATANPQTLRHIRILTVTVEASATIWL